MSDKILRKDIDDIGKRNNNIDSYKNRKFNGKRTVKDEYTGKTLYYSSKGANANSDAARHYTTKTTSNTDHVVPLDKITKKYGDKLPKEKLKKIANSDYNLVETSETINKSKGALSNHEYLAKQLKDGNPEDITTTYNMLKTEVQAEVSIGAAVAKEQIVDSIEKGKDFITQQTEQFINKEFADINRSGLDEATSSATFAAVFSITKNTVLVCKGEEKVDEALKEVLVDTSSAYALGYAVGAINKATGIADTSSTYMMVNAAIQNTKHMVAYVNGEIDERQLVESIAETSAYLVSAYIGKCVGHAIGDILLPGIGGFIGQYIGEMITTAICTEVISTIKATKAFEKENARIISLYKKAEREIRASQERLKELAQRENQELITTIQSGFDEIKVGIQTDSYDMIKKGLATIGSKFGFQEDDFSKDFITRENLFSNENIIFD